MACAGRAKKVLIAKTKKVAHIPMGPPNSACHARGIVSMPAAAVVPVRASGGGQSSGTKLLSALWRSGTAVDRTETWEQAYTQGARR